MAQFYYRLKDRVKDNLAKGDRLADLQAMITKAILIDNCLFERELKKRGHRLHNFSNRKLKGKKNNYWLQPIELDTTQQRNKLSKEQQERYKKDKLCFSCRKLGHYARNCK